LAIAIFNTDPPSDKETPASAPPFDSFATKPSALPFSLQSSRLPSNLLQGSVARGMMTEHLKQE
jgi:hypothetical protein